MIEKDTKLYAWMREREELFPNNLEQVMTWYIVLFQYDITIFAMGSSVSAVTCSKTYNT